MSGLKATPGPWKVGGTEQGSRCVFRGGDVFILPALGHAGPISIAAGHPNAHLIAAAPELYEALSAVVASSPVEDSVLPLVIAALAKARGES
jgi:hypothetical protein